MTPQRNFNRRCTRHQTLVLDGLRCAVCVEEERTGQQLGSLRGERREDLDGRLLTDSAGTNLEDMVDGANSLKE